MELQKGKPVDTTNREEKEIRVYNLLDELGIEYERTDHEAAYTMEACNEIDRILDIIICKNLFLCNRQETDFYLLMMPGNKKFKTKDVSKMLGTARLSFAKENYMEEYLDITPGSVSVMGLMNDKEKHVQLLVDRDVIDAEYIGCHPCVNTSSLKLKTKDMIEKYLPAVDHNMIVLDLPVYEEETL